MEILSRSAEETKNLAKEFVKNMKETGPLIVELVGDLGAGKTTFMKGVGEFLGIKEDIVSPTFLIQRNYDIDFLDFKKLIHIDAYRIEEAKELSTIDWENYSSKKENLIFIEWSQNLKRDLESSYKIFFSYVNENERKIIIQKNEK
ncbi:MAG: tRNA (adenosine(37)-N6)-threonylcarbamoyltransferase complex ATPase subunit type 1 TsaE [Bacteroidetes bacterium]|nr:tRNA (adenosine(37)-N6)-threonylcarbamoyltransferase complex ATPase subunit type 1 TsaE [Bacteroidota bacterium]